MPIQDQTVRDRPPLKAPLQGIEGQGGGHLREAAQRRPTKRSPAPNRLPEVRK